MLNIYLDFHFNTDVEIFWSVGKETQKAKATSDFLNKSRPRLQILRNMFQTQKAG